MNSPPSAGFRFLSVQVLIAAMAGLLSSGAGAQIPDEFENLKVLPSDISKAELVETMKGFAMGLGVRCSHCHVGEPTAPLDTYDFASDEKLAKGTARIMLKMVQQINAEHIALLEEPDEQLLSVGCMTCHRGQPRPLLTSDALMLAYSEDGISGLKQRYAELHGEYFGTHTYDFSERTLLGLVQPLVQREALEDALELTELILDEYPQSFEAWFTKGDIQARMGDFAAAQLSLEQSLKINDHPFVRQRLDAIKTQAAQAEG